MKARIDLDDDGDCVLVFPDEVLIGMGWELGDALELLLSPSNQEICVSKVRNEPKPKPPKLTLICMVGLPASGKSVLARKMAKESPFQVVEKDEIRKVLRAQGWKWSQEGEKEVVKISDSQIIQALEQGISVISSDTNIEPKHQERLKQLAEEFGAEFVKLVLPVPLEECLRRNKLRGKDKQVPEEAIRSMDKRLKE
jgi:predicted kinase